MKTSALIIFLFTATVCTSQLFSSCAGKQQQAKPVPLNKVYKDSTFLQIQGDLNDPKIIWGEVKTYLQAFDRVVRHSKLENNRIILEFNSARDINISTNIYDYIKNAFEAMNTKAEKEHLPLVRKGNTYIYGPESEANGTSPILAPNQP